MLLHCTYVRNLESKHSRIPVNYVLSHYSVIQKYDLYYSHLYMCVFILLKVINMQISRKYRNKPRSWKQVVDKLLYRLYVCYSYKIANKYASRIGIIYWISCHRAYSRRRPQKKNNKINNIRSQNAINQKHIFFIATSNLWNIEFKLYSELPY